MHSMGDSAVAYRSFARPNFSFGPHSTDDWIRWIQGEQLLHEFAPTPSGTCSFCGGVSNPAYTRCWDCGHDYSGILDDLLAASYSLDSGLESLLHRYKDWTGYEWAALPLATILYTALSKHKQCLELTLGANPVYTWVPSNNPNRKFDHIERLIDSITGLRAAYPWEAGIITRNPQETRPGRRELKPEAYVVDRARLAGRSVLLVDDVWTSGSSMVSAAKALKDAGAPSVVGLVLGRQLNRNYTGFQAQDVYATVAARGWTFDECSLIFARCA